METKRVCIKKLPPDGGWGWLIVLGSSLINFSTRAIEPSFGLLFGALLKQLGVETAGASLILSTLGSIVNFSGILVGPLIKKYHYRKIAIIGGVMSSSAILLTAPANSMIHILITFGVLGGIGFGLATACTFVCINEYFSKRKAQAVGLSMAGTAVGFMIMPQIVRILLDEYDFRSALFILGAISLHSVVGACLFQPVAWHQKAVIIDVKEEEKEEENQTLLSSKLNGEKDGPTSLEMTNNLRDIVTHPMSGDRKNSRKISSTSAMRKASMISYLSLTELTGSALYLQGIATERSDEKRKKGTTNTDLEATTHKNKSIKGYMLSFYAFLDLDLLKDGVYLNILFGLSMCIVTEMNFTLIAPFFLSNLGFNNADIAIGLSSMAIADLSSRVIVPPIIDKITFSRRVTFLTTTYCMALCRSCLTLQNNFGPIIAVLVVTGLFRGISQISMPLVLAEYSSGNNFPSVIGLAMVSGGLSIVVCGPLTGYLRDVTNSYPLFLNFQTLLMTLVVISWAIELFILKKKNNKSMFTDDLRHETK